VNVRKGITILLLAAILVLVMSGCKLDLTADVYVQDLLDLAQDPGQVLYTSGTIAVESPGSEALEELKEFLSSNFREVENFRTESKNISPTITIRASTSVM